LKQRVNIQLCILSESSVNPEVIPRDVEEERALPPQSNSVKNIRQGASCAGSQAAASV
jgi:hypothetical protein